MSILFIGLPAYNERDSIDPLFKKIEALRTRLLLPIVVLLYDDGCTDGTGEEVKKWRDRLDIQYIDGGVNRGLGTAMNVLLTTFANTGTKEDILIVMDCDDTHDPAQMPSMLTVLEHNPEVNVVIASRYRRGATTSGVPFHRMCLSLGCAVLYKAMHPIYGVLDYTCGYRAYRYDIITSGLSLYHAPFLKERGFACMVELLLKLKQAGATSREIPLFLAYDNKRSASKMNVSGNASRLLWKLLTWHLRGFQ